MRVFLDVGNSTLPCKHFYSDYLRGLVKAFHVHWLENGKNRICIGRHFRGEFLPGIRKCLSVIV